MAVLNFKRIKMEDLKGAPQWVATMLNPLNLFLEQTANAVNGQLTFQSNVSGMSYSTTFATPANYLDSTGKATGKFNSFNFQYLGKQAPSNCIIGSIDNQSGAIITNPTALQWSYNNSVNPPSISITYVAGLQNSSNYSITVTVF